MRGHGLRPHRVRRGIHDTARRPAGDRQRAAARVCGCSTSSARSTRAPITTETIEELVAVGSRWLDAGAVQLVVEARESAADVGVFDAEGRSRQPSSPRCSPTGSGSTPSRFEAPNKASQFAFLSLFGPDVRLSNVRIEELLRVEIYRRGLHSDAFQQANLTPPDGVPTRLMPQLEVVPARESTPYETVLADDPVVVVSDVIRATTTATTASPAAIAVSRCRPWKRPGPPPRAQNGATLLAGEQGGEPIPDFDLNNSPAAIDRVRGQDDHPALDLWDAGAPRRA